MYELSCPSCKHKVNRPFVRIGAQAVCKSCAHRFVVQNEYVNRRVTIPPDTGEDKDNPLLLGGTATKPPPPPRPVAAPPPRPVDEGVPISTVAGTPTATAPALTPIHQIPSHQEPSPDVARLIARHRARRQRKGRIIAAVAVITLLVIGVILWIVLGGKSTTSEEGASLGNLSLQVVSAQRLDRPEWQMVEGETFDGSLPDSRVTLENQQLLPLNSQFMRFSADVRSTGFDVVEDATLHLMVVDRTGILLLARCQMPLMLLSGTPTETPRKPITVYVPRNLTERGRIVSWVRVKEAMAGGAMFPSVVCEPLNEGSRTAIKIIAFNPLDSEINRCVFLIRAFDEQNATVARWRVEINRRIGPQQRVEFAALTPVEPNWSVASWEVVGAGGVDLGSDSSDATD